MRMFVCICVLSCMAYCSLTAVVQVISFQVLPVGQLAVIVVVLLVLISLVLVAVYDVDLSG